MMMITAGLFLSSSCVDSDERAAICCGVDTRHARVTDKPVSGSVCFIVKLRMIALC